MDTPRSNSQTASKVRRETNRSCEPCRILKVKCVPENNSPTILPCSRCAKSGKVCLFAPPRQRRPRKRNDSRIAELEKEVENMQSLIRQRQTEVAGQDMGDELSRGTYPKSRLSPSDSVASSEQRNPYTAGSCTNSTPTWGLTPPHTVISDSTKSVQYAHHPFLPPSMENRSPHQSEAMQPSKDVIDLGILSLQHAKTLFHRFVTELVPHYPPMAVFRPDTPPDLIRKEKPILFLAILAAAAGPSDGDMYSALNTKVLEVYAEQIIMKSKKSIEIVQSLLITAIWSIPSEDSCRVRCAQLINMAGIMALDLGIDKNTKPFLTGFPRLTSAGSGTAEKHLNVSLPTGATSLLLGQGAYVDSRTFESRRTLLACYLSCSSIAVSMRRPNTLRFTSYMEECIGLLEETAELPTDKYLVAWLKLQRLTEEFSTTFRFDEPNAIANLAEPRIQLTLKGFERQLSSLKDASEKVMHETLAINFHHAGVNLHEIAMYNVQPHKTQPNGDAQRKTSRYTPSHIDAISACIYSAHSVLDEILDMNIIVLRAVPVLYYLRMQYCIILLIKLDLAVRAETSEVAEILDRNSLLLECYMEKLIPHLVTAAGEGVCRPASKYLEALLRVKSWYEEVIGSTSVQQGEGQSREAGTSKDHGTGTFTNHIPQGSDAHRPTSDVYATRLYMSNLSVNPMDPRPQMQNNGINPPSSTPQGYSNFVYFPMDLNPMLEPQFDIFDDVTMYGADMEYWMAKEYAPQ